MPPPERLRHHRSSRGPADAEIRKEEEARRERGGDEWVWRWQGSRKEEGGGREEWGVAAVRGRREEWVWIGAVRGREELLHPPTPLHLTRDTTTPIASPDRARGAKKG